MTNLLKTLLYAIYNMLSNYGWSVIVFTLVIKGVLVPLDIKSRKSMRAMAAINPKLEALKKKYANDQEKLNQKTQELYKKNNINPLAGCLPTIIQLPILWCMFSAMRQAADEQHILQLLEWVKTMVTSGEGENAVFMTLTEVQAAIEAGTVNAMPTFDSWLWIKNVFQPDSFTESILPSAVTLQRALQSNNVVAMLNEGDLQLITKFMEGDLFGYFTNLLGAENPANFANYGSILGITARWPSNWALANGYLILPVLAGLTQWLSANIMQDKQATQTDSQQGGMGNFMKYFFPIFSVWICFSSTSAFSIYWVFVNIFTIASTYVINKILDNSAKAPLQEEA